jgi:hypothetical protein
LAGRGIGGILAQAARGHEEINRKKDNGSHREPSICSSLKV